MNAHERNLAPLLDRMAPRVGNLIRETTGQVRETVARAGEKMEERIDGIEMKFDDVRDSVIDTSKELSQKTRGYIRKNPWAAIGISAGFAFLVGLLIGRRRND